MEGLKAAHKILTNKLTHFKNATQAIHAAWAITNTNLAALNKDIENLHNKCSFLELLAKPFKQVICFGFWSDYNPLKYLKMG